MHQVKPKSNDSNTVLIFKLSPEISNTLNLMNILNATMQTGKNLLSLDGIPVMKTGELKLLEILHKEHPVFIRGMGLHFAVCLLLWKKNKTAKTVPFQNHMDACW